MASPADSVASAAYATFALLQPIPLDEIAAAAPARALPFAATTTPDWFAAAASDESSLLDTAPELLVLAPDIESPEEVDVRGIDLIHVYAPELQDIDEDEEPEADEAVAPVAPAKAPEKPRTSTQIGLLKELSNLDT